MNELPAKRTVAIVCFTAERQNIETATLMRDQFNHGIPVPRLVHYQVTLDPANLSPSGRMVRFGLGAPGKDGGNGDEITGWQPVDALEIIEIIAVENEAGELSIVVPDQPQPVGEQQAA